MACASLGATTDGMGGRSQRNELLFENCPCHFCCHAYVVGAGSPPPAPWLPQGSQDSIFFLLPLAELRTMNQVNNSGLRRALIAAVTGLAMGFGADAVHAANSDAMLETARKACLESAASQGWQTNSAKVISSKAIDPDRVEIVFDLTKDGVNIARLTCPYSAKQGVLGKLGSLTGDNVERKDFGKDFSRSMATAANEAQAVNRSRAWWLLLPVALAGLSWAALRGSEEDNIAPRRSNHS
jgi:hypothetical protein